MRSNSARHSALAAAFASARRVELELLVELLVELLLVLLPLCKYSGVRGEGMLSSLLSPGLCAFGLVGAGLAAGPSNPSLRASSVLLSLELVLSAEGDPGACSRGPWLWLVRPQWLAVLLWVVLHER